ncbi:MAG: GIY-YIG nuclease family protein [Verrucomicrobiota bacterium]|nr:GIY-YIG nuclease family protein [Verrucomicrobiota bacterium]
MREKAIRDRGYFVYVLRNSSGKYYIGITSEVARRLREHNDAKSKWTKKFGPWQLAWQEGPMSLGDARKMENRMKRQKGGKGLFCLMAAK